MGKDEMVYGDEVNDAADEDIGDIRNWFSIAQLVDCCICGDGIGIW